MQYIVSIYCLYTVDCVGCSLILLSYASHLARMWLLNRLMCGGCDDTRPTVTFPTMHQLIITTSPWLLLISHVIGVEGLVGLSRFTT